MKWIWLLALLLLPAAVEAQDPVFRVRPLATAKLSWKWVPRPKDGGEPTKIFIRCHQKDGEQNLKKDVPGSTKVIPAKQVVGNRTGAFDCTWQGWNDTGLGPISQPYTFGLTGGLPPAITDQKLD